MDSASPASSAMAAAARARGLALGAQRLAIIHALEGTASLPTADEIQERARTWAPRLSIATVYRTLAKLEQHGLVLRLDLGDRIARYADASQRQNALLVDADSGDAAAIDDPLRKDLEDVLSKHGFDVRDYRLTLKIRRTQPRWTKAVAKRVLRPK